MLILGFFISNSFNNFNLKIHCFLIYLHRFKSKIECLSLEIDNFLKELNAFDNKLSGFKTYATVVVKKNVGTWGGQIWIKTTSKE